VPHSPRLREPDFEQHVDECPDGEWHMVDALVHAVMGLEDGDSGAGVAGAVQRKVRADRDEEF
jgi:hypothetical protein